MALPTTPVPLSTNAYAFITSNNYATMRTALGVGTTDSPTLAGINPSSNLIVRGVISIGYGTLTTTNTNLAIGYQPLHNLVTGNTSVVNAYNTAIGFQSLNSLLSGGSNIAVGGSTLRGILSGSFNTAIGLNAGYFTSNSTIVSAAGNSIFIGTVARPLSSHQTDQIVIGREAVGLGSNTTVIGNSTTTETRLGGTSNHAITTYGTYTDAGANYERLSLKYDSGSLSYIIGTEQQGTGTARALKFRAGGEDRITVGTNGNIGIGTALPLASVDVYFSDPAGSKELLRLRRASALAGVNGDGQQLRFLTGSTGVFGSGFILQHVSTGTDNFANTRNYLRLYDEGISIESADTTKVLDVNTTLGTIAITNTLNDYRHGEGLYGKLYIGGTFLTASTNNVRAVRVASVATLGTGYAYACFDASGSTAGTNNNDHIVGVQSRVRNGSTGTLTTLYGSFCKTGADAGTTTNAYGHYVDNSDGAGTILNQYGLYINTLTKGTTSNYAIFTNGSTPSVFGGPVSVQGITVSRGGNNRLTNTAVGSGALVNNGAVTDGNTAVGYRALAVNTDGGSNTAVGSETLILNTNGSNNTGVGWSALYSNTIGDHNTVVGSNALYSNTTGDNNAVMGYSSLVSNLTGSNNVAIGYNAGSVASNFAELTDINNSILIGTETKTLSARGDTNSIVIGHAVTGKGSNTVVLGNDSITTTYLKGDIGIGANTFLVRDNAANTLALRNSTNSQTLNIYSTYTDSGNYQRLRITANGIAGEGLGSGAGGVPVSISGSFVYLLPGLTPSTTNRLVCSSSGAVGIGISASSGAGAAPVVGTGKLNVNGDLESIIDGGGLILRAAGTSNRYRITLNAAGNTLVITQVT